MELVLLRPFEESDYKTWAGAEPFKDGTAPHVYGALTGWVVIASKHTIEVNRWENDDLSAWTIDFGSDEGLSPLVVLHAADALAVEIVRAERFGWNRDRVIEVLNRWEAVRIN